MSRQSRAALAAAAGVLIGLGTLAGVVLALRSAGDSDGDATAADTGLVETGDTGALPPVETTPVAETRTVEVGAFPNAVAVGEGSVWVVQEGRRVVRIDPQAGEVIARVGAGDEVGSDRPCGIAVGAGAVWVTTESGTVARLNPETNRLARVIEVDGAACIAVGAGGVWVTSPELGVVTRIDPLTNDVVAQIAVAGSPLGIATGFGAVWVASPDPPEGAAGALTRINRRTDSVENSISLPNLPEYVTTGANGVWVTAADGSVRRVDPQTDEPDEPVQIADTGPTTVAVGGGAVWAAVIGALGVESSVRRIDPATGDLDPEPIPAGESPLGLAFGAGSLWVANYEAGTLTAYSPAPAA